MSRKQVSIFWFRRDLRVEDNHGLFEALNGSFPVLPLFIIDKDIVDELEADDARISFIHEQLLRLNEFFNKHSSGLYVIKDNPKNAWKKILHEYDVQEVYFNEDYEPYAKERDTNIKALLIDAKVKTSAFKDHVVFAKDEILKADQTPYTIYTPYKNKWLEKFNSSFIKAFKSESLANYFKSSFKTPSLKELGFSKSNIKVSDYDLSNLDVYENVRNIPALDQTSHLSPHLRFGTVSIRKVVKRALKHQDFLNELIWRDFFIQILHHFPKVVSSNFKSKYDNIDWRNNDVEFEKWKNGETGYPIVDAGMRELNATGYMHNRVRMITAGFLCKHLLIDWRWGEAYFAKKLLDYELASNNGNWQWAAGTGCDSAPYFRVFNPSEQVRKFDKDLVYVKRWVPELETLTYPLPIVDHKAARERAIKKYKQGINSIA